jgi:hypothetical protein
MLAPIAHRLLHKFHLDDELDPANDSGQKDPARTP